jgi:hypothetical protein
MRTILLSALALGMLLGGAKVARAGFFDACMAPGDQTITVVQNTTVRSENVTFQANGTQERCLIEVNDGVALRLESVTINVVNDKRINFSGGDASSLVIASSSITACDHDIFGFQQVTITSSKLLDPVNSDECDLKEIEVTGDITITGSTLRASTFNDIQILSETGNIILKSNTLLSVEGIEIGAQGGAVTLSSNRLTSESGGITIRGAGQVSALSNVFRTPGTITITGNPCTSQSNSPPVPCT